MERIKWTVVVALWVTWSAILAMRWVNAPQPSRMPLKFVSGQRLHKTEPVADPGVPRIVTWRPSRFAEFSPVLKNIFAPLPKPHRSSTHSARSKAQTPRHRANPPPAPALVLYVPPPSLPPPPPPSAEEVAAQRERQQRELAAEQARQQMGQYRYLGYLTQLGEPRAFLGKGSDLFIVRAGDLLEGQIHVTTIDGNGLTLRDSSSAVERILMLTEIYRPSGF